METLPGQTAEVKTATGLENQQPPELGLDGYRLEPYVTLAGEVLPSPQESVIDFHMLRDGLLQIPLWADVEVIKRILNRVQVNPATGCWECSYYQHEGYAQVSVRQGSRRAHRRTMQAIDYLADNLHGDHRCVTRNCVYPRHLVPATPAENNRAKVLRARHKHQLHFWQVLPYEEC